MRQPPRSRQKPFARRFLRAERGATAVEFALVALPMLVMVFGLLELALVFLVGLTLDNATQVASRQIRTGEFQTGGGASKANFKTLVCANMSWLQSKCAADLWLDVQTFSNFAGLAASPSPAAATFDPNTLCFSAGQPTDIVLVRAFFEWDLFTPLLDGALENMGGGSGKRLISSTTAFRNEPFNNTPPVGAKCT